MSRGAKTQSRFGSGFDDASPSETAGSDWFSDINGEDDELIGRVIDNRYELLSLIGRGGMGSVYKAQHRGIHREVALKLLHPSLASVPEIGRRFEREAFAIGRISHPNCVDVSDFGRLEDGSLYLVMEFLRGHSLGDELADQKRLSPTRTLHILKHILQGLGHAHENDIVHRDVKPENVVLVEQDGDKDFAKILDFGIAKLIGSAAEDDGGVKLTQAGMAFGTPIYMSPEQAVGNPVDGRADLYAASVMAFEMITGHPPFESDDKIDIMSMHTSRPVPAMSEIAPDLDIPPAVEHIIRRGLAKRPQERYLDADEYIAAIDAVLAGGTATGPVPGGFINAITGEHGHGHALTAHPNPTQSTYQISAPMIGEREPRARWGLRLGLMSLAVAAIGFAVYASMGQTQSENPDDPEVVVKQASDALDRGDPKKALSILENNEKLTESSPKALLVLGHTYAITRQDKKALETYTKALELDNNLTSNAKLRANLSVLGDNKNHDVALDATAIMATRFDDTDAKDKLIDMASEHKKQKIRRKAAAFVGTLGLEDRVDWVQAYMLDLVQGRTCKLRKEVVGKLRALGDPRAISALKRAQSRRGKHGRSKGKRINSCLRQDAIEAVDYLKTLEAANPKQPSATQP